MGRRSHGFVTAGLPSDVNGAEAGEQTTPDIGLDRASLDKIARHTLILLI